MTNKERWARAKREIREANADLREKSREIEFKKSSVDRPLKPGMRTLLWTSIILNICIAMVLATTIIGIPIATLQLIGCIYVYQKYLRRGA